MSRIELTPTGIVLNLLELSRQLDALTQSMDQVEADAVNAREDYTMAKEMAFLKAEGPQYLREAKSKLNTHNERLAAEVAEAKVRGLKRQIDTIKIRIEVGRSASAAVRADAEFLTGRT